MTHFVWLLCQGLSSSGDTLRLDPLTGPVRLGRHILSGTSARAWPDRMPQFVFLLCQGLSSWGDTLRLVPLPTPVQLGRHTSSGSSARPCPARVTKPWVYAPHPPGIPPTSTKHAIHPQRKGDVPWVCRQKDNVKMDIREILFGGEDRIYLDQYRQIIIARNQWRALLDTVRNICVPRIPERLSTFQEGLSPF
jgi:hypothetical protein